MVHFTPSQMHAVMGDPDRIRNVTICAHVDAGKSTTTDALVALCGIISKKDAGSKCETDTRVDEQERGITIKSTGVSMYFEHKVKGKVLINVIDSPGHVDFSSEVTAALRNTDGAVVLIDIIDGVKVQTRTVVRQAISEGIRPVLMMNKLDRPFLEMKMDSMEIYKLIVRNVEDVNALLSSCPSKVLGDILVDPVKDTILFGSGFHQWGFTLGTFAKIYAPKFEKTEDEMKDLMWNWFYNPAIKNEKGDVTKNATWSKGNKSGKGIPGMVYLVIDPIKNLCDSIMDGKEKKVRKMLKSLDVKVPSEMFELIKTAPKQFCREAMTRWLPLSRSLLGMIIEKLPSPREAQKYRADLLYTGGNDRVLRAMKECDPDGPTMVYISKMVPVGKKFYAFGRVFSGTIKCGISYRIMGPDFKFGGKEDLRVGKVQNVVSLIAKTTETMPDMPCGNTVALVGIDKYLQRHGTITDCEEAHPIKGMNFAVSPIVRRSVTAKNPADMGKLKEGLRKMQATDPIVEVIHEESGGYVVAGAGELHLEICLKDLQDFMGGAQLVINDPVVPYRETVVGTLEKAVLCKSPNNHNRLWCTVEPLNADFCDAMEAGKIEVNSKNEKEHLKYLHETFGMDKDLYSKKKCWAFGPTDEDPNTLVNATSGVQFMDEIRAACKAGFIWGSQKGPLCDEPLRGVQLNIKDVQLHADSIHRGQGQIMPPMRRVLYGAMLSAQPRLQEPIFAVTITVPQVRAGGVYGVLSKRRGEIQGTDQTDGGQMCIITANMPVDESFGFDSELRSETGGTAFAELEFSHWQTIDSDPFVGGTLANTKVNEVRKRKGLGPIKMAEDHLDKL